MNVPTLLAGAVLLLLGVAAGLLIGASRWRHARTPRVSAELAGLLTPATDALQRVEQRLRELDRDRAGAYAGLSEQVASLHRASAELGAQTRTLSGALQAPTVRGRWGEVQLQRIVELAGMVEHCDFDTQVSAAGDWAGVRPDLIIRLAGGRHIPVDAKVPFAAWLESRETQDPRRRQQLQLAHARALRAHVDALAAKSYWRHFQPAPEFVVMFVPGEALLDAAMVVDPSLAEHAFAAHVVIATPGTLIALLRTIAFTWRQERLSASAEEVLGLGRELHSRLATVGRHLSRLGRNLDSAVEAFNAAVGSMESRVLVSARKFTDLGVATADLPILETVQTLSRTPQAAEFIGGAGPPESVLPTAVHLDPAAGPLP